MPDSAHTSEQEVTSEQTIFPQKIFIGKVEASEFVVPGVKKITVKIDQPFGYFPWQYVWLEILKMKFPDPRGNRRAFSIFNVKNDQNTIKACGTEGSTNLSASR